MKHIRQILLTSSSIEKIITLLTDSISGLVSLIEGEGKQHRSGRLVQGKILRIEQTHQKILWGGVVQQCGGYVQGHD